MEKHFSLKKVEKRKKKMHARDIYFYLGYYLSVSQATCISLNRMKEGIKVQTLLKSNILASLNKKYEKV